MRRGFNLAELLIATVITATVMVAVMAALDASFKAYRSTAEATSSGVSGRIIMDRLQGLIRNGLDFAPVPGSLSSSFLESNELQIQRPDESWITIAWDPSQSALTWSEDGVTYSVIEGVTQMLEGETVPRPPFLLEFQQGRHLLRATIDLCIIPDGNQHLDIEGDLLPVRRLVGSAMPRNMAWNQ